MKNLDWLTSITPTDTFGDMVASLPNAGPAVRLQGDDGHIDERSIGTWFGSRSESSNEYLNVEFDDEDGVVFAELSRPFASVRKAKAYALRVGQMLVDQGFALDGLERQEPTFRTTFHDARIRQYQTWIVGERQTVDVVVWSYPKDADSHRASVCVATHIRSDAEGQEPRSGSASYPGDKDAWAGWEDVGVDGLQDRNGAYFEGMVPPTPEEWAAMERPDDLDEPAMEEVLASIRHVMSEDDAKTENAGA